MEKPKKGHNGWVRDDRLKKNSVRLASDPDSPEYPVNRPDGGAKLVKKAVRTPHPERQGK